MKKSSGCIETYTYKGFVFEITYNKSSGNYYAKNPDFTLTYSDDLEDLRNVKIPTVVYQNTEFKLVGGKRSMINEDIDLLRKEIEQWRHLTIGKIKRLGYFYSDAISILELYKPNTVCDVLNKNYNLGVTFIALGKKYMIFCTENFDTNSNSEVIKLQNMFNNHFGTNGEFPRK
ncbi:hypothetical protein [Clostridium guangxiense]|uniref:hypothetical protein n=1 Tax=Clostridium guangxiense TaxID=1662055 RepID=UPI001E3C925D|nr:hypothetical protein [Clostridium guangxiense]MCD2346230.1 hypothetical protein [Clostridium guangxiense]